MEREDFRSAGKNAALYPGSGRELPLVVLNCFEGDGSSELRALKALQEKTDPADCGIMVAAKGDTRRLVVLQIAAILVVCMPSVPRPPVDGVQYFERLSCL